MNSIGRVEALFFITVLTLGSSSHGILALPSRTGQPQKYSVCEAALGYLGNEENMEPNIQYLAFDSSGGIVGSFTGYVTADGLTLLHSDFQVDSNWRRQGISRETVIKLLKQKPHIKIIRAALIGDNLEVYLSARRKRVSKIQALTMTPFFKVFAPFGFNKIKFVPVEDESRELIVVLEWESSQ